LAAHKKLAVSCHFAIFLSPVNFDFHFILFLVHGRRPNNFKGTFHSDFEAHFLIKAFPRR